MLARYAYAALMPPLLHYAYADYFDTRCAAPLLLRRCWFSRFSACYAAIRRAYMLRLRAYYEVPLRRFCAGGGCDD